MKKKHPEHVNLERWLVSYADFITLLFAFFVVMYAISQADIAKFKKVSESLRNAFATGGLTGSVELNQQAGWDSINALNYQDTQGGRLVGLPAGKTNTAADREPELVQIQEALEESISLELGVSDLSNQVQMGFDSRGLVLRLAANDFFSKGQADVSPDLRPLLDRIGKVLSKSNKRVRVEGHSDISEAKTKGFSSDWELSAARAAWVIEHWIGRFGINPARMTASGLSHYHPLTEGTSEIERGKNRRVEIIVLKDHP